MPVTVDEMVGSPEYNGGRKELSAKRRVIIAWSDINNYYQELFPSAVAGIPQLPALLPGSSVLFADHVTFRNLDENISCTGSLATYDEAVAEVSYKTIPYEQADPNTDQIITRRWSIGGEFMTLPNVGLRWAASGANVDNPDAQAGKFIPHLELHVTLHDVTAAYYTTLHGLLDELVGTVNNATFEGGATGTVLLLGGEFLDTTLADGSRTWQVELRFAKRVVKQGTTEYGWNYMFDDTTGTWLEVETQDGDPLYEETDFSQLY